MGREVILPRVLPNRGGARNAVATYHEAQLAVLVAHVGDAVDRFHAGELDAFGVDEVIYQYGQRRSCGSSATTNRRKSRRVFSPRTARQLAGTWRASPTVTVGRSHNALDCDARICRVQVDCAVSHTQPTPSTAAGGRPGSVGRPRPGARWRGSRRSRPRS